ncbi:hypothetical protein [Teredinibacter purpureus]|uniref:hypothetical protein n=1 Tax=Teredinibacter purpureus TaxID=2731756 RepID=UPI0005F80747|nr:hypothetical protein [Teredinibacter purpureus]
MNRIQLLTILFLSVSAEAWNGCDTPIGKMTTDAMGMSSTIYVECKELKGITKAEAADLIRVILEKQRPTANEIFIFFVASKDYVGVLDIPAQYYVGDYYNIMNKLTIWPRVSGKTEAISIK